MRAAGRDLELVATVLRPRALVVTVRDWTTLTEAHGLDSIGGNAALREIPLRARRATLAKGDVVLDGTAFVGVAGDANHDIRVGHQHGNLGVERGACVVAQIRLVEIEVDDRRYGIAKARLLTSGRRCFVRRCGRRRES
jgi:hypothetical protein